MDTIVKVIKSANVDIFEKLLQEYLTSITKEYVNDVQYQHSAFKNNTSTEHSFSALVISRRTNNV